MKCHIAEYALEFAKHLMVSNATEVKEIAEEEEVSIEKKVAEVAFDFAEAF